MFAQPLFLLQKTVMIVALWMTSNQVQQLEDKSDSPPMPATIAEAKAVIDLTTFPKPSLLKKAHIKWNSLDYSGFGNVRKIREFYDEELTKQGWTDITAKTNYGGEAQIYEKSGHWLYTLVRTSQGLGKIMVVLAHQGNFRPKWLPRYSDAALSTPKGTSYRTAATIVDLEFFFYRQLLDDGWIGFTRLHQGSREELDRRSLTFIKNGTLAKISFGRPHDEKDKFFVQLNTEMVDDILPLPDEASWVEFSATEPHMVLTSTVDFEKAAEFYHRSMPEFGWKLVQSFPEQELIKTTYIRDGNQIEMSVGKTKGGSIVQAGKGFDHTSWGLQVANGYKRVVVNTVDIDNPSKEGIEIADFPILNDAFEIERNRDQLSFELKTKKKPDEVAKFYIAKLTELGWVEGDNNLVQEDFARVSLHKGDAKIHFNANLWGGVIFGGNGLWWNKKIPEDDHVISFETWLKRNGHPASTDRLDEWVTEMKKLGGE